jgi:hypothetical protein
VTKHEEPSTHKLAGARWRPMFFTHPYTDDICGNRGRFQVCVVVSTQLSGSNPDARTSLPTHTRNETTTHEGSDYDARTNVPTHTPNGVEKPDEIGAGGGIRALDGERTRRR